MKWYQKHTGLITEIISMLFILLFVYAAVNKLWDLENFRIQLGQSPMLTSMGDWVAWIVPAIELVIAGMLIVPRLRHTALYAAFSLMTMFTAYIYIILTYSPYVPCSCGGILEKMGWKEHLIFNSVFVLLAMTGILILSQKRTNPISQTSERLILDNK
ncbi:hypothetical protein OOZ15_18460 [Galbibacter sp. EGI 63066]|uniref:MauE/DoxX family redox-associated membrane protein n=1 Tax=Galbibacter sp. EGI 63066 TaxID=2993559 RepID=UPI0022499CFA|nr:MauE/DoxX family redox-associated membrane protein [Galbibacter sp. EGI 63066]MCX2681940.1 hypothetical protein [Galbibacter sp. EGI 63066]